MSLKIGVVGATGALGREIIAVLDAAPWRPETILPLASAACETPFVNWGSEQVAVDDLGLQAMEGLDAVILAVPPEVGRRAGEAALQAGVPVVAVDTPTAVDLTSGELSDPVVRADLTITFHRPKSGLRTRSGAAMAGRILVAPIGIPAEADRG